MMNQDKFLPENRDGFEGGAGDETIEPQGISDEVRCEVNQKKVKRRTDKMKTEPANPFGQFLKIKRSNDGEISFDQILLEWKGMDEEDKALYRKLFEEEKAAMGPNYRFGRKRKLKQKSVFKQNDKKHGRTGPKVQEAENKITNLEMMAQVETLDKNIDQLELEAHRFQEQLRDEKVKLEVKKFKLEVKTSEGMSFTEKYKNLIGLHSNCN